ncbi:2-dehydro-3-deoxyphosphooctonate aldolase [Bienertia sinuspersici]
MGMRVPNEFGNSGCNAAIYACIDNKDKWILMRVVILHKGHNLNPSQSNYKRHIGKSSMTACARRRSFGYHDTVKSVLHRHENLAKEKDGGEMPLMEKDVHNVQQLIFWKVL